ncbi:MAG: 30S ribosome-binding factor RbfA [Xanthomonadales bacterium]|nr:30S ribosome-binding factor RbfA [Xanthomonadales bacterium]NIX12105.1 30S ribosome-binding factor RbfA [Xanthomonadales bacterium]
MASQEFRRADRVAGQMRRELARLIQMEIKDPGVGFVSVSDVEVSRDLAHAKVYVTVFEEEAATGSLKALRRASGFLRRRLGQEMRIRNVPELHFLHDASVETGQRMDRLIATAVASDTGAEDSPAEKSLAEEDGPAGTATESE